MHVYNACTVQRNHKTIARWKFEIWLAAATEVQRQRETALQEVKVEEEAFKPQLRSFPVLVLQPGSQHVAFAAADEEFSQQKSTVSQLEKASIMSSLLSTDLSSSYRSSPQSVSPPFNTISCRYRLLSAGFSNKRWRVADHVCRHIHWLW